MIQRRLTLLLIHQVIQKINKKQYKFIPFSQCQNNKIGTADEAEHNINARGEMMEDGLGPVVLAPDVQHEHAGNEEEGHHQHRHRPHLEHNNGFYDAKLDSEMCKRNKLLATSESVASTKNRYRYLKNYNNTYCIWIN